MGSKISSDFNYDVFILERCDGGLRNETRECCSVSSPCKEGQGDCDTDEECRGDLVCGRNNCGNKFDWKSADCCETTSKILAIIPSVQQKNINLLIQV